MKFIYNSAKHRQSGTTMQKTGRKGAAQKKQQARSILEGFPAKPFESLEDVERYTDGDRIICLICGKPYKTVLIHTSLAHNINEEQYRNRFNIPASFSLVCTGTKELLKAHGQRPENLSHIRKKMQAKAKPGRRRKIMTSFAKESSMRGLSKIAEYGLHARNETDCEWHLSQVRSEFAYKSVPVPAGELSWSGYKKRRLADTALDKAHKEARRQWRECVQGKKFRPGRRTLSDEQITYLREIAARGLQRGEVAMLAREWGVGYAVVYAAARNN